MQQKRSRLKPQKLNFRSLFLKQYSKAHFFQIQFPRNSAAKEVSMSILKNKYAILKVSLRHAIYTIYPPNRYI